MALYTIGDLHLSLGSDKPMDIFGDRWQNYVEKIQRGFSAVTETDTTVLCGDLSWGMSLEESLNDLTFIHNLPGRKILMKGNHDYWWNTAAKMQRFFDEHGLYSLEILRLLQRYGVKECYFGHLHGAAQKRALEGRHYNTEFHLVAADYLDFTPVKICD